MAQPVGILVGAAGLAVSAIGGLALGQYAVSGVDPTKAAAYSSYAYQSYDSAAVRESAAALPVVYADTAPAPLDTTDTLY